MNTSPQAGLTLPEMLAAILVVGMVVALLGSLSSLRLDAAKIHGQRAEARHIATLLGQAHAQGLLAADATTPAELQAALSPRAVPQALSTGHRYTFDLSDDDPRLQISLETRVGVTRTEVVRPALPVSELRIPLWRAQVLRRQQEAAE